MYCCSGLPSSTSTTAHATGSATTTMTSLGVASSSGTAIGAPNMPSEITEEIVKEVEIFALFCILSFVLYNMLMFFFRCLKVIVVEADTELQEPSWRSLKQENEALKKRLKEMEEELEDKDSDLEQQEALISVLSVKEHYSNDEIQEARKLLISVCKEMISIYSCS